MISPFFKIMVHVPARAGRREQHTVAFPGELRTFFHRFGHIGGTMPVFKAGTLKRVNDFVRFGPYDNCGGSPFFHRFGQ